MSINKKIGVIIKELRQKNGFTQIQLAEKANISTNYVSDIERGKKDVSLKVLDRIAIALDVRLDNLISIVYENNSKETINFETVKKAYKYWKSLNNIISNNLSSRKVNLPEAISENIVCYALGYQRNMLNSGDATDEFGNLIEIKATANFDSDLSSFSPDTHFDKLIFLRMNLVEDKAYIYDLELNGEQFSKLKVNHTETVLEQQKAGRRPRLQLIKYIEEKNLKPIKIVQL